MERLEPSTGWGVLHLYYRVDRARAEADPLAAKRFTDAVRALRADDHQALCMAVLGHKADLGVMALGPDLARLASFERELLDAPLEPVYSYVSLTEVSAVPVSAGAVSATVVSAVPVSVVPVSVTPASVLVVPGEQCLSLLHVSPETQSAFVVQVIS